MDKIKVNQGIYYAMKELESWVGVDKHRSEKVLKIAELLAYGYEVENTPEEELIKWFKNSKKQLDKLEVMGVEHLDEDSREEHFTTLDYHRVEVATLSTVFNILKINV
ncbi:hypothetical protein ACOQFO_12595 [Ureibacillus sp. MALMAid1270]|uniref:hypothetical protein n=1 Tax=Ureibacillus sp. MALMAid1270 TaxID=3411629 RepID=UPI003BA75391